MRSRRTRARLDWGSNLAVLGLVVLLRRGISDTERPPRATADTDCATLEADCTSPATECSTADTGCSPETHAPTQSEPVIETPALRADWFLIGVVSAVLYRYLLDHDIAGLRRSRVRRWTLVGTIWAGQATLAVDEQDNSHSLGVGSSVGAVCYRLKYGVLYDVPDR